MEGTTDVPSTASAVEGLGVVSSGALEMLYSAPMRKTFLIIALAILGLASVRAVSAASTLGTTLSGRILMQVGAKGGFWYVYPVTKQRYYLDNDQTKAATILMKLSLPVSPENLALLPVAGSSDVGNSALRARLSGRVVRLSGTSALWYISPVNKFRYDISVSPLTVLKPLGLGISAANIALIPVASGFDSPKVAVNGLLSRQQNVATAVGTFLIDLTTLDLDKTTLKIKTDTGNGSDCKGGCAVYPLKTYVDRRKATFGMHGSYFCPSDYASCAGQTGSYYYQVLNSFNRTLINSSRMKYTNEPFVTFDFSNTPTYYGRAKDFLGSDLFSSPNLTNVQAAIGNGPALIEAGKNVANPAWLDTKQRTIKSYRGAMGWKGRIMYFFVVHGATVTDSAAVAKALDLDYAINLDGGGSTAMYQNSAYILGPGRGLPNAILLVP